MEVLVGSTFRDRSNDTAHDQGVQAGLSSRIGLRRCDDRTPSESWSSSVGESSENEEEQDDAVSSSRGTWFDSFTSSLEDSLPIKRGLSNHYIGKSKSFGNLMEAESNAKGLDKVESPLNKRRRLLIANKLRRRRRSSSLSSSFSIYSNKNPNSMPLLALQESDDDLEDIHKYNDDNDDDSTDDDETSKLKEKRMKITNTNTNRDFMVHHTKSCFSFN
ncbi:PREDICTED: uncharacterized protein LOC104730103 isoform X1 [Camelina sativa]|uniref:Uncharacterized protein LOC104730103 isoform X1 n=1 Tax=Camelina sativa TaxID=90675 RepID=A0ABM0UWT5_CAMSA|nr:PREDICTED: uncharacterized protein LOC104730103 isoform X1 [Camelina sativa]